MEAFSRSKDKGTTPPREARRFRPRKARARTVAMAAAGLVALTGSAALTACGGGSSINAKAGSKALFGKLPPVGTAKGGGTITEGQLQGSTPTYILPVVPGAQSSVYTAAFWSNLFLPLYTGPKGYAPKYDPALNLANMPTYSNGGKTVTIKIKPGYKWSDGKPVTANDVAFFIAIIKAAVKESPANWNNYTPGYFPDSLTSVSAKGNTLVMNLKRKYNPGYFTFDQADLLVAFPTHAWDRASAHGPALNWHNPANAKKIYNYLKGQGSKLSTFATNPLWKVVDGPFKLTSFTPSTSAYSFAANPSYGGSIKPRFSQLKVSTYTSATAQLNQLLSGNLDVGGVDPSQLGKVGQLKSQGYSVFGYPTFGFFAAFFNFKDATNHFNKVIGQLYVRQALAHLVDQPLYIRKVYHNAGGAGYGPVPAVPVSPFTPPSAIHTPYPFSISAAKGLLSSHGWKVAPGGTDTCAKPGSGKGECGAGIPKGTPLSFNWFTLTAALSPTAPIISEAFASDASKAGIHVTVEQRTFNFLIQNYNDASPSDAKYTNKWAVNDFGGFTNSLYPTTESVFNTTGVFNTGAYSSPTANKLINNSVFGKNISAVKAEANFLTHDIPGLFQPNSDEILAVSKKVGGAADGFTSLTQAANLPQYWYLVKK